MENKGNKKGIVRRVKMHSRLVVAAIVILVLAGLSFLLIRYGFYSKEKVLEAGDGSGREAEKPAMPHAFEGASFESSGVVFVPGSNGVLFIDDSKPVGCFWMQLDDRGEQLGPVKYVHIDASVEDPESITFDGSYFYILGSQSEPQAGKRNALIRFRFDPNTSSVSNLEVIEDLRSLLLRSVPELRGEGEKPGTDGGLNVEGIAWDPQNEVFLLGLRSPLVERQSPQALLIPIRLKDPNGPFSIANVEVAAETIKLRLGTLAIRDIHYDSRLKSFLIISGAPKEREKGSYSLWQWDGRASEDGLREITPLDARLKPEGITRVEMGGSDYLFIVYDSSSYSRLDYSWISEK